MGVQEKKSRKYNAAITKLFQIAIELPEEKQMVLLRHAEEILAREKRISNRASCNIPVNFAVDYRVYTNQISNISQSGLFIDTQKPLEPGDDIIMTFNLDGFDKPFKIRGEIAHSTAKGTGVKFIKVSPYIEEMIDILIQRMK